MEKHWAYCSACDRQVAVVVREGTGEPDPLTGKPTDALVCLEAGHTCTGALCPITEASPEEMRKARQDLRDDEPAVEED